MDSGGTIYPLRYPPVFPRHRALDAAYIPSPFNEPSASCVPILLPQQLLVGESVYSVGFFALGGQITQVIRGYFSGRIVNFFEADESGEIHAMMLPYPIIEGMSGSPVLTYHNGPKVVGLAYGNQIQRVVASEVLEYKDGKEDFRETIHRVVEFGLAYHPASVAKFLLEVGATPFVTDQHVPGIPGLES